MFGIEKPKLVLGLTRIGKDLCCYHQYKDDSKPVGSCDCKYGYEHLRTIDEKTGHPEVQLAATIINAMTPSEYQRISKRAKII